MNARQSRGLENQYPHANAATSPNHSLLLCTANSDQKIDFVTVSAFLGRRVVEQRVNKVARC